MRTGKISEAILTRSVIKLIDNRNDHVVSGAVYGRDCAVIDAGDNYILTSTETALRGGLMDFYYAVVKAANNIAAAGGTPVSASVAYILKPDFNEPQLKVYTRTILAACRECGIELAGGHTEVSEHTDADMITVTVTGICAKNNYHPLKKAKADMDIVLVGDIALEETVHMLEDHYEELAGKLPLSYIDSAKQFIPSIVPEGAQYKLNGTGAYLGQVASYCYQQDAVAIHDLSEGGIFGALWELAAGTGLGLTVDVKNISIRQETVEFSEIIDINPYQAASAGAMLVITADGEALTESILNEYEGRMVANTIGKLTVSNDKMVINGEETRFLNRV